MIKLFCLSFRYFGLTYFAMHLNEANEGEKTYFFFDFYFSGNLSAFLLCNSLVFFSSHPLTIPYYCN